MQSRPDTTEQTRTSISVITQDIMTKKPNKSDQEFLEAYETAGFTNATQTYQELHPDVSYQTAANRSFTLKKKYADYLTERYEAVAGKSLERAAKYVLRLEKEFFSVDCKSTAVGQIGRMLLQSTGVLDGGVSGGSDQAPEWVQSLNDETVND